VSAPPAAERTPSRTRWTRNNVAASLARFARPVRGGAKPVWRAYGRVTAGAAVAAVVLVLTMIFIDVAGIRYARQAPVWLHGIFAVATDFGLSGWFLFPLAFALLLLALINVPALSRMNQLVLASISVRLSFLFLAIAVPGLVVAIVKRLVGRARPLVSGEDAFVYKFFLWRVEYASFPSGHATTAFAAAIAFGVLWPRLRPLFWAYGIVIALSRVIVAAHHPSDVLAGAIAGVVGALLVRDWMAARGLGFVVRPDGSIKPLPGPSFGRIKRVARALPTQ
jgi:undecaprenyl-diphosphatase